MIEELANLLDDFPGPANQTRCFTHVLNLVVKSIIWQFDAPNSKNKHEATNEMLSLMGTKIVRMIMLRDGLMSVS